MNINPELGKPEGSYFGLVVTDGYDWNQCYSWAWECLTYFGGGRDSFSGNLRSFWKCFPDCDWKENQVGLAHQAMAIHAGLTEMPEARFFETHGTVDRG